MDLQEILRSLYYCAYINDRVSHGR